MPREKSRRRAAGWGNAFYPSDCSTRARSPLAANVETMAPPEVMIQVKGLQVRYGVYRAVDGIDLDLFKGELFG